MNDSSGQGAPEGSNEPVAGDSRSGRAVAARRWAVAALMAVAAIALLWVGMFALLANWRPGVRVAQAPAIASERARPRDSAAPAPPQALPRKQPWTSPSHPEASLSAPR